MIASRAVRGSHTAARVEQIAQRARHLLTKRGLKVDALEVGMGLDVVDAVIAASEPLLSIGLEHAIEQVVRRLIP